MRRKVLTKAVLEQHSPKKITEVRDSESPLVFRLMPEGGRSFCVRTRVGKRGRQVRITYEKCAGIENLADARSWARRTVDQCRDGTDPRADGKAAQRPKFEAVVADYLKRRVREEKKLRTADEIEATFARYFTPRWKGWTIDRITRHEVNTALDDIFDKAPVAADRALAQLRACFNWWQLRDDTFDNPIVKGMARTNPRKRQRGRVLTDEEIRVLWTVAPKHGMFGAISQTLLLSAQRRTEVAAIARSEIARQATGKCKPGDWTIPAERYKTDKDLVVPLPAAALSIIDAQDQVEDSDLVFTTNGETAFSGFSNCKDRMDVEMLALMRAAAEQRSDTKAAEKYSKLEALLEIIMTTKDDDKRDEARAEYRKDWWTLHDLRRTAKTLMSSAGVRPDISERVLGHVIEGVEGVYDRYEYLEEKRDALERLAALVDRIVNPPASNVVMLREAAE